MSGFSTPKKTKKPTKDISPKKYTGETRAKISESHNIPQEPFVRMNKPSQGNPFASQSNIDEESTTQVNIQPSRDLLPSRRRQTQSVHLTKDEREREFENAKEAFINMREKLDNPYYNIKSDPNYKIFDRWANTIKGDTDIEKGLTIKKKNNEPPTIDELNYITKITPYLLAYKIHCNKFSTTEEELNKCYKMYTEIKKLIDKFRDNGIKFFRGDLPSKEIINMPHFPIKTTKKAHSFEKIKKSKSMKNKKARTYSLGGKKRKTLKNRK
jgi:hypothetical protein